MRPLLSGRGVVVSLGVVVSWGEVSFEVSKGKGIPAKGEVSLEEVVSLEEGLSVVSAKGGGSLGGLPFSWAALDKALVNTIAATSMTK
jgi:hypothetical protein